MGAALILAYWLVTHRMPDISYVVGWLVGDIIIYLAREGQ
jgi:hypothetical protein